MANTIIYRVSNSTDYAGFNGEFKRLDIPLNDDEHYLFREEWSGDEIKGIKKVADNFIKVVNDKWLNERSGYYYNVRIYDDIDADDNGYTEYNARINNLI